MIVTSQKPLDEILDFLTPYTKILIVGCDGCTQPPRGLREAKALTQLLELGGRLRGKKFEIKTTTVAKQCDTHLMTTALEPQLEGVEAILSLACGLGVQTANRVLPNLITFPAQDSLFAGMEVRESGTFEEWCSTCGDCILALTGGICPVARCSKGLLNGACGGSKDGKCELDPQRDCAWVLIYEQLKKQGKLQNLKEFRPPRDYQLSGWRVTP